MSDNLYNKQEWNRFILENKGSFLQSYEWGEFQAEMGKLVIRFSGTGFTPSGVEGWAVQFIENKLPGVNKFYWHCPRGPVIANSEITPPQPSPYQGEGAGGVLPTLIKKVKEAAGKGVIFFRLGPEVAIDQLAIEQLNNLGFQQLPYDIEPSQTLILDISKSEDELLAQMHEKWRYNIRLAERKGVTVKLLVSDTNSFEQYFEEFYRLVSEGTAERKNIRHYPKEYYRQQLTINNQQFNLPAPLCVRGEEKWNRENGTSASTPFVKGGTGEVKSLLFVAEYESKVIAANIVVIFGNKATYLHGATSSEHREVMAPHLLQWEQIKYAKAQGCSEYDFWGIVNEHTLDKRRQSWEGFTRFKRGFGGQEVNYVGYWDYPLNKPWYFLYRLVQKFRR